MKYSFHHIDINCSLNASVLKKFVLRAAPGLTRGAVLAVLLCSAARVLVLCEAFV
jgi:hypothetical protein